MSFEKELDFLRRVLEKLYIEIRITEGGTLPGLSPGVFGELSSWAEPNTVYMLLDSLRCSYIFMLLPGQQRRRFLVIGPYLRGDADDADSKIPVRAESFLRTVPRVRDEHFLLALVNSFAETLWGGGKNFTLVDINRELEAASLIPGAGDSESPEDKLQSMKLMEGRYAAENQLLQAISHGQVKRAKIMMEAMLSGMGRNSPPFERRSADLMRDLKNYSIISNTLMRKAAENGGVHPISLNSVSKDFAFRINSLSSPEAAAELMEDMLETYCRLVQKQTAVGCSDPVRRAMAYIDSDPAVELSLSRVAAALNISPEYLSTLFKKDTGRTITDYIARKRMEMAASLLGSSKLQIQTVALRCGFSDVNYFSKTFKKYFGITPREYRKGFGERIGVQI